MVKATELLVVVTGTCFGPRSVSFCNLSMDVAVHSVGDTSRARFSPRNLDNSAVDAKFIVDEIDVVEKVDEGHEVVTVHCDVELAVTQTGDDDADTGKGSDKLADEFGSSTLVVLESDESIAVISTEESSTSIISSVLVIMTMFTLIPKGICSIDLVHYTRVK